MQELWGLRGENLWLSDGYRHSDMPLYNPEVGFQALC